MARPKLPEKTWYAAAAAKVVRNNISLRAAANELDIPLDPEEAERISRTKAWQDVIWAERHKFNTEIANAPGRNKTSLVGLMSLLIQELIKAGDFDKAIDGLQKIAKIEGWDKSSEVNLFAGITTAEFEAQKREVERQLAEQQAKPAKSSPVN